MELRDLKIGNYVRTKYEIRKIVDIMVYPSGAMFYRINKEFVSEEPKYYDTIIEKDIIKASDKLIDLIEVGDYVNGLIVNDIVTDIDGTKIFNLFKQLSYFENDDIKSIVTKESFEQMSYKVGD